MKLTQNQKLLLTAAGAGFVGLCLRSLLYRIGFDEKGILSSSHPLHLVCLVLGAAVAVYLGIQVLRARNDGGSNSWLRFLLGVLGGYFLLLHGLALAKELSGMLSLLRCGLALLSALAMMAAVFPPLHNRRMHMVCHASVCAFFAVDMLSRYQNWSGNPQLPDYCFHVLACVALSLCSYHRLAFDTGLAKPRMHRFCCLMALFLCLLSIVGPEGWEFYLGGCFWAAVCLDVPAMFLPEYIRRCIDALEGAGYQAWAVGGCVRDSLLGLTPQDYDLCTDAKPEQTEAVFADFPLILNGKKHGTVGVIVDGSVVEITTFRTEGDYQDNRHPEWVEFVPDIEQDLARRDFTVNAMAYSPKRGFADPYGGREDLENKVLRAVGSPDTRFTEDALRILRGVRFAVRYGLTPEKETERAMAALAPRVQTLAMERVYSEISKLLPLVTAEDMLRFAPVLMEVIPELKPLWGFDQKNRHHIYDIYTHTAHVVAGVPADLTLRWAALLHDIGKPASFTLGSDGQGHFYGHAGISAEMADAVLRRLKAPTALREQVVLLIDRHMLWLEVSKPAIRRWISRLGMETMNQLMILQEADTGGKGTEDPTENPYFSGIRAIIRQIEEENGCLTLKDLAVNGHDLMELGFQGREIGEALNKLLNLVLEDAVPNEKAALIAALAPTKEETP